MNDPKPSPSRSANTSSRKPCGKQAGFANVLTPLALAGATLGLAANPAQALVVTVNSVQYDVTTFTGSYIDNIGKFNTEASGGVMPW